MIHLQMLLRKEKFVNRWRWKALRYLLAEIAPRLASRQDYHLLEEFRGVIRRLNEPYQPRANHYEQYLAYYIVGITITSVRVTRLIREVLGTVKLDKTQEDLL